MAPARPPDTSTRNPAAAAAFARCCHRPERPGSCDPWARCKFRPGSGRGPGPVPAAVPVDCLGAVRAAFYFFPHHRRAYRVLRSYSSHVLQRHSNFRTSTGEKFCNCLLPLAPNRGTVPLGCAPKREFAGSAQAFFAPASFGWTRLRNKVQALKTNTCSQRKPKCYASVLPIRIRRAGSEFLGRGRPSRERGQMRTRPCYSPPPRRARGPGAIFCTGGHDLPFGPPSPARSSSG